MEKPSRQEILVGNQSLRIAAQTENTYFELPFAKDRVGWYKSLEGGTRKIIVRTNEGELG
jgi:hypothetical protein